MTSSFERHFVTELENRLSDENLRIQVLVGPRQVGKTTGIKQFPDAAPIIITPDNFCTFSDDPRVFMQQLGGT